jgi:hypothetical protein
LECYVTLQQIPREIVTACGHERTSLWSSNLLRDQEATALKFGYEKTVTSARSSLILYTQKGLPNRKVHVEVRPCSFDLSASEFLSKVFSVPRVFPAFNTKEKAVARSLPKEC